MADWTKLTLIDNIQYDRYENTIEAVGRFYAKSVDIPSALPVLGDAGPAPLTTWKTNRVSAVAESPLSYVVTVYFRDSLYIPVNVVKASVSELSADYRTSHDTGTIYVSAEMLGLKKIQAGIAPVFATGTKLDEWVPSAINIATGKPYDASEWLDNGYVPTACPFTKRPHYKFLGKELQCSVVILVYNCPKANVPSTEFRGVNSSSNIPSGFDIDDRTTAGKWRALRQTTRNIKSREGTEYRKVRRWLVHPPRGGDFNGNALVWDDDKCGGTFTW